MIGIVNYQMVFEAPPDIDDFPVERKHLTVYNEKGV